VAKEAGWGAGGCVRCLHGRAQRRGQRAVQRAWCLVAGGQARLMAGGRVRVVEVEGCACVQWGRLCVVEGRGFKGGEPREGLVCV
jgi:hypothetical protein